jgi:putative transposase
MLKAFQYRVYPTKEQEVLLNKHFGSVRFVYNRSLGLKKEKYETLGESLSKYDLQVIIKELKHQEEFKWLNEINSQSIQGAIADMDTAYTNFFKHGKGFPKFKKKFGHNSFHCPQSVFLVKDRVIIPKFKEGLKIIIDRLPKGVIRSATVSRNTSLEYYISILCETGETIPLKREINEETSIGIDLGIKDFAILSNGDVISNPHYHKNSEKKIKKLSKDLSRKTIGSKRYGKAKVKLAKAHGKVKNRRKDFLNKRSTEIVNQYDTICLEDLNIKGMSKRCKAKKDELGNFIPNGQSAKSGLNKAINDVGWGEFTRMLKYKAEWKGKNILQIGRFESSSKTCSHCGYIKKDLTLKDREWICPACGVNHDRDLNAALNIRDFALKNIMRMESPSMDVECLVERDFVMESNSIERIEALKILQTV